MFINKNKINNDMKKLVQDMKSDSSSTTDSTFNMLSVTLTTGIPVDAIKLTLLEKLPPDSPRRAELMNPDNQMEYPGGYNAYLEDVKNGYFTEFNLN